MNRSVVSIIVPVYNACETLERCVLSILNQSYRELEVLLVNDGSKDESLALMRTFALRDARVRILNQANMGVGAARNHALNQATGKYVQFVDSDDCLPERSTERMVRAIESENCEIAIGEYDECVGSQCQRRGFLKSDAVLFQAELLDRLCEHPNSFYYGVLWNKLYVRSIIIRQSIRCLTDMPWGEDFAFNMQYMRFVGSAAIVGDSVYRYYRSMNGMALRSAMMCTVHPINAIKVKMVLHQYYKQLYIDAGLYEKYKNTLSTYLFKVTINN